MKFLQQVQASLESINGYEQPLPVKEFIVASKEMDQLIIKENADESEVLICLREAVLQRLSSKNFPDDFHLDLLPDLSVVIEELSHFNTYCLSASQDREISAVELEVQGEVDKFSVALEFLHQRNEDELREKVFETLFERCELGEWVQPEVYQRYFDAHQIARNFCRNLLKTTTTFEEQRETFREFFTRSREQKLGAKYGK